MADWNALLDHLAAGPREDGTPELAAAAQWLFDELQRRGLSPDRFDYVAHPWRLRIVGVVVLLAAAAYVVAMVRKRHVVAALVTLAVPAYLIAELDFSVPLLGALHSASQQHVIATVPASGAAKQRLVFAAHYDTKTDLLDHVERTPITLLGLPLTALMLFAALRPRPRLTRIAQLAAAFNGLGLFLVQTGGAFVSARSPGAVDDGAGCAVVMELASALREGPLEHSEVRFVFFSGEEIGLQGSAAYAATLDRSLPIKVVNLDGVGQAARLAVFRAESGVVRSFAPDPALLAVVDEAHRAALGEPLYRTLYPATTDARSFLAAGIPAVNLASDLPEHAIARGMHSKADERSRVSVAALDSTLALLLDVARRLDSNP